MNYGFEPVLNTPGNVAGLGRFDELLGCSVFHSIYGRNANVFAAVPSLHAAYMVVAVAYAIMGRCKNADSFVLCYHGGYLVDGCLFRTSLSD